MPSEKFCPFHFVFDSIELIRWIRWIQLESVKHDWRLLKAFLCLPLTVGFRSMEFIPADQ